MLIPLIGSLRLAQRNGKQQTLQYRFERVKALAFQVVVRVASVLGGHMSKIGNLLFQNKYPIFRPLYAHNRVHARTVCPLA